MDEDIIEIDQLEPGHVVLVIPARHFIVIGRTLEEARDWVRSALEAPVVEMGGGPGDGQYPVSGVPTLGDDSLASTAA